MTVNKCTASGDTNVGGVGSNSFISDYSSSSPDQLKRKSLEIKQSLDDSPISISINEIASMAPETTKTGANNKTQRKPSRSNGSFNTAADSSPSHNVNCSNLTDIKEKSNAAPTESELLKVPNQINTVTRRRETIKLNHDNDDTSNGQHSNNTSYENVNDESVCGSGGGGEDVRNKRDSNVNLTDTSLESGGSASPPSNTVTVPSSISNSIVADLNLKSNNSADLSPSSTQKKLTKRSRENPKRSANSNIFTNIFAPSYNKIVEDFHKLFPPEYYNGNNGILLTHYSCALQTDPGLLEQGKLFVTSRGLFFTSFIRLKLRLFISFGEIEVLKKHQVMVVFPTAILVAKKDATSTVFASFTARDKSLALINHYFQCYQKDSNYFENTKEELLWKELNRNYGRKFVPPNAKFSDDNNSGESENSWEVDSKENKDITQTLRHSNTEPIIINTGEGGLEYHGEGEELVVIHSSHSGADIASTACNSATCEVNSKTLTRDESDELATSSPVKFAVSNGSGGVDGDNDAEDDDDENDVVGEIAITSSDVEEVHCKCEAHGPKSSWVPFLNNIYSISVDSAFNMLFEKSHFYHTVLKRRDATKFTCSEWKNVEGGKKRERELNYTMPTNSSLPIAPKSVDVTEMQYVDGAECDPKRMYGAKAICKNHSKFADSFLIHTKYCLTRCSKVSFRLQIFAWVEFIGWVVMKDVIRDQVHTGLRQHCEALDDALYLKVNESKIAISSKHKNKSAAVGGVANSHPTSLPLPSNAVNSALTNQKSPILLPSKHHNPNTLLLPSGVSRDAVNTRIGVTDALNVNDTSASSSQGGPISEVERRERDRTRGGRITMGHRNKGGGAGFISSLLSSNSPYQLVPTDGSSLLKLLICVFLLVACLSHSILIYQLSFISSTSQPTITPPLQCSSSTGSCSSYNNEYDRTMNDPQNHGGGERSQSSYHTAANKNGLPNSFNQQNNGRGHSSQQHYVENGFGFGGSAASTQTTQQLMAMIVNSHVEQQNQFQQLLKNSLNVLQVMTTNINNMQIVLSSQINQHNSLFEQFIDLKKQSNDHSTQPAKESSSDPPPTQGQGHQDHHDTETQDKLKYSSHSFSDDLNQLSSNDQNTNKKDEHSLDEVVQTKKLST